MLKSRTRVVVGLGTAQTLAWASTCCLPAMLAVPMAHAFGIATPTVYAAFSVALLVSAVLGPAAARLTKSTAANTHQPARKNDGKVDSHR
jgi:hypothetical protein